MDFFLSKLIPLFVYPAGFACLCIVLGLIISKKKKLSRLLIWVGMLVIFLGGNRWISMSLVRSLEQRYLPPASYPRVDAIVILGGGTDAPQYPRSGVEVNGAGDRLVYGYKLYREGVASKIIVTGASADWQGNYTTTPAHDMSDLLQLFGVPAADIIQEADSLNTAQDAEYSAKIIQQNGWKRVILVTSAMHMPRAARLFQQAGVDFVPMPVDYTISDQEWQDLVKPSFENILINLLPTAGNLKSTTSSMKEYIGMAVNQLND